MTRRETTIFYWKQTVLWITVCEAVQMWCWAFESPFYWFHSHSKFLDRACIPWNLNNQSFFFFFFFWFQLLKVIKKSIALQYKRFKCKYTVLCVQSRQVAFPKKKRRWKHCWKIQRFSQSSNSRKMEKLIIIIWRNCNAIHVIETSW